MHFVLFGCIWYRLFALQNSVQNGPTWCKSSCHEVVSGTQSTPLAPKLMFHSVSYYFGAFGTVWLCYKTQCKMGQADAKVRATKSRLNFSQPTHPIHPHWNLNSCFDVFRTIWMHLGPFGCLTKTQCKTGRTGGKVRATKSRHNFSQRTHRIDPLGPKLMFWCVL